MTSAFFFRPVLVQFDGAPDLGGAEPAEVAILESSYDPGIDRYTVRDFEVDDAAPSEHILWMWWSEDEGIFVEYTIISEPWLDAKGKVTLRGFINGDYETTQVCPIQQLDEGVLCLAKTLMCTE